MAEVDSSAEIMVPTQSFQNVIHPSMPQFLRQMYVDTSVVEKRIFEIFPEPSDMEARSPLTFVCHETSGYFIDASNILVDMKLKLKDTALVEPVLVRANFKGYLANNLCSSLWSTVKVTLNNTNIESNFHNQQLSRLTHLLSTPDEITKQRGVPQGAFPIKNYSSKLEMVSEHMDDPKIIERIKYSSSEIVHVRGPLGLDMSTLDAFLPDGVNLKITLEPTSPRFIINKLATDRVLLDYEIISIKLIVCKIKPAASILLATQKSLMQRPIEYIMRRNIVYTEIIPQGRIEWTVTRPYQELIPSKLYVWFVDLEASNGQYRYDPFFWDSLKMADYTVRINGVETAKATCDDCFIEPYLESLEANGNNDYFIPYNKFTGRGCFVLCFNTNNASDQNSINLDRKGNLSMNFKFRVALARSVKMYVTGIIDSTFNIDADRSVITNYQF